MRKIILINEKLADLSNKSVKLSKKEFLAYVRRDFTCIPENSTDSTCKIFYILYKGKYIAEYQQFNDSWILIIHYRLVFFERSDLPLELKALGP